MIKKKPNKKRNRIGVAASNKYTTGPKNPANLQNLTQNIFLRLIKQSQKLSNQNSNNHRGVTDINQNNKSFLPIIFIYHHSKFSWSANSRKTTSSRKKTLLNSIESSPVKSTTSTGTSSPEWGSPNSSPKSSRSGKPSLSQKRPNSTTLTSLKNTSPTTDLNPLKKKSLPAPPNKKRKNPNPKVSEKVPNSTVNPSPKPLPKKAAVVSEFLSSHLHLKRTRTNRFHQTLLVMESRKTLKSANQIPRSWENQQARQPREKESPNKIQSSQGPSI